MEAALHDAPATETLPQPTPEATTAPRGGGRPFTRDNAAKMQALGIAKLRERRAKKLAEMETPTPVNGVPRSSYVNARIRRVRKLIEKVTVQLENASDPLDIDRLSRSLASLSELEMVLDGRPKPGQLRPRSNTRQAAPTVQQIG